MLVNFRMSSTRHPRSRTCLDRNVSSSRQSIAWQIPQRSVVCSRTLAWNHGKIRKLLIDTSGWDKTHKLQAGSWNHTHTHMSQIYNLAAHTQHKPKNRQDYCLPFLRCLGCSALERWFPETVHGAQRCLWAPGPGWVWCWILMYLLQHVEQRLPQECHRYGQGCQTRPWRILVNRQRCWGPSNSKSEIQEIRVRGISQILIIVIWHISIPHSLRHVSQN